MRFDISEIGAIQCQLNFDEDYYLDYLQENGLQDSDDVKKEYIKGQCDYDVTYLDSEYFHDMGEYDTMTIEEIEEEFGNRCAEDVFITCMDGREHDFEIQAYQDSIDINNPKELNAEAVKCLRHGGYFKNCRGFILTNGVVVYTGAEHNMCSKIPGINGTFDFIRLGNIRVLNHGVDIAKPPTEEQKKVLNQMFQSYYGEELYLDLMNDKNGHTGKKYNSCEPYEVMQDIYDYFNSGRLRQNTYESVKIDLTDIKQMVSECVKKILSEYHNAIDEKIEWIAILILNRLKNGETNFKISKSIIEKYYPYSHPETLYVSIDRLYGKLAAYSPNKKLLKINELFLGLPDDKLLEVLMHELTHWVNDVESSGKISKGRNTASRNTEKERLIYEIIYLFDSSEIQARATQLKYSIKSHELNNFNLEQITHVGRMLFLINEIKKETYLEYSNSFGQDNFGTIVEGLLSQRAYYKWSIDGKERFSNLISENEFNAAKSSILKRLTKKLNKFKNSINKILNDFYSINHK